MQRFSEKQLTGRKKKCKSPEAGMKKTGKVKMMKVKLIIVNKLLITIKVHAISLCCVIYHN